MKFKPALLILLLSGLSCGSGGSMVKKDRQILLFNKVNLEDWIIKVAGKPLGENFANTFRVEDGLLKIRYDKYGNFEDQFGAIFYKKPFRNFKLLVEYRFVGQTAPGAPEWGYRDSGIQFLSQSPQSMEIDQKFPVCVEYNLHGGNGDDVRPNGQVCLNGISVSIGEVRTIENCSDPAVQQTFHGDQWVVAEIESIDGNINHYVNGEIILKYEDPQYDPENAIVQKLNKDQDLAVREGYISLQSNSHPIDFRRIEIIEY